MPEIDLREALSRAVLDLPTTPPEAERTVRRARRRAAGTVTAVAVAVVAAAVAIPGLLGVVDRAADRPAGRVTTEIAIADGSSPVTVAAGADWVWIVRARQQTDDGWRGNLSKVDRDGSEVASFPVGSDTAGVTFQMQVGYGAVWVLSGSRGVVVRVDEETGETSEIPVPGVNPSLDVGAGGVWLARTTGELVRVDPASGRVDDTIDVGGRPVAVAAVPGTVWVADEFDGTVRRVDPASGDVTAAIETGADLGPDVVADHRGMWTVACRPLDGSDDPRQAVDGCSTELLFVDARTNAIGWSLPLTEGAGLRHLDTNAHWTAAEAVDRHGVWVTMSDLLCESTRFGPCAGDLLLRVSHAGDVLDHIDLGVWIKDVAAGDGTIWIADVRRDRVLGWSPTR